MMTKDLWVLVETNQDGAPKGVGIELLSPGRRLAAAQGGKLGAVVICKNPEKAIREISRYDVDYIMTASGDEYERYSTDAYAFALTTMIQQNSPITVLIGATSSGRDLAPRISSRLKTGLTADCIHLEYDETGGNVIWTRPAFGGNLMAEIICPDTRPQIGTVRPGVFKKPEPAGTGTVDAIDTGIHFDSAKIRTEVLEVLSDAAKEKVDLAGADIVVAGGRGLGNAESFGMLRELADVLGGVVASSRGPVDMGWISAEYQVGQTGKTVHPKLYIACGISGAIQHQVGMNDSEVIIAINKDADAPIFEIANYGLVGDVHKIIPALMEEIKRGNAQ